MLADFSGSRYTGLDMCVLSADVGVASAFRLRIVKFGVVPVRQTAPPDPHNRRRGPHSTRHSLGEPLQVERPAFVARHTGAHAFPAFAVALEVAVLELDPSAVRCLGDEAHLDLARLGEVGLDLPLRADVPTEHDSVRRLVGEHARPAALAAVDAAVVEVAAHAWLEHSLRDLDREQVVLPRLEAPEFLGEDAKCALDRRIDHDGGGDRRFGYFSAHVSSLLGCSTADL